MKADKGNEIVAIDAREYKRKVNEHLNDPNTYWTKRTRLFENSSVYLRQDDFTNCGNGFWRDKLLPSHVNTQLTKRQMRRS